MKKLILGFAAVTVYLSSFAQTDSSRNQTGRDKSTNQRQTNPQLNNQQQNNTQQTQDENARYQQNKDCIVMMQNGEVKQMKEGRAVAMEKQITLENGAVVKTDGMVTLNDGRTVRIKEGECVDKSGKVSPMKDAKMKKEHDSKNIQ